MSRAPRICQFDVQRCSGRFSEKVTAYQTENGNMRDIYRPDFCEPLPIDADIQAVVDAALRQKFIPIIDGRGCLSGMVTRQNLIRYPAEAAIQ